MSVIPEPSRRSDGEATAFVERHVRCASPTGLHRMVYGDWGDPENPDVLFCVHGMARNRRDFDDLARAMARDYRVICPDVVGRGGSDWLADPLGYDYPQYVADMMVLLARINVDHIHWLGTSMGGLIGMWLASQPESPITRLVLNDVGPLIPAVSLRRIGEHLGRAPTFGSLQDAENYLRVVSKPFGPLTDAQWRHLTESSLRQAADGRLEMRYDPGIGAPFRQRMLDGDVNLWPIYDRIRCPTLVVRGAESDLLTRDTLHEMAERGPRPRIVEIAAVGHAPMFLDAGQIALVRDFLRER